MRLLASVTGIALVLAGSQTANAENIFTPSVALEVGQYQEQMTLELEQTTQRERRSLTNTRLALGLDYTLDRDFLGLGELRGHSSVGLGIVYYVGQWPLQLRQEATMNKRVASWLRLVGGVEAAVQINASRFSHSYAEIGLVLGVDLASWVELLYRPSLSIGLASDSMEVFGGELRQSIATDIQPLNVSLRFHSDALGW